MNRLFDVFHDRLGGLMPAGLPQGHMQGHMMPSIGVSETDQEMRISADLPGVSEDDISVSLVDDILTIRGEKKLDEKANYHIIERSRDRAIARQLPAFVSAAVLGRDRQDPS